MNLQRASVDPLLFGTLLQEQYDKPVYQRCILCDKQHESCHTAYLLFHKRTPENAEICMCNNE